MRYEPSFGKNLQHNPAILVNRARALRTASSVPVRLHPVAHCTTANGVGRSFAYLRLNLASSGKLFEEAVTACRCVSPACPASASG